MTEDNRLVEASGEFVALGIVDEVKIDVPLQSTANCGEYMATSRFWFDVIIVTFYTGLIIFFVVELISLLSGKK